MDEQGEQVALFFLAKTYEARVPDLALLFHVPNGGKRDIVTAANLKRAGVKAGVPDVCLPVPRGEHVGLWIEMKVKGNKPTEHQARWIEELRRRGHRVEVCYTYKEAWHVLEEYLGVTMPLMMCP